MRALPKRKSVALARKVFLSGTCASITSAIALAVGSRVEEGSAAGGLNGPSQWLWGEAEAYTRRATVRHTAIGYAIHHITSVFWAAVLEAAVGSNKRKNVTQHCVEAAGCAAVAYVVDYHVTPRRFRPGFKKHMGPRSIFAVYSAFAAGLAIAAIMRDSRS
jgi:hypothetical protein